MNREQKLIDICFELVATVLDVDCRDTFIKMSQEDRMLWVANQLKQCGFNTVPCGASWGILK